MIYHWTWWWPMEKIPISLRMATGIKKAFINQFPEQLSKCKLESLLTLCGVAALFHAMVSLIKLLCHLSSKSLKGIFLETKFLTDKWDSTLHVHTLRPAETRVLVLGLRIVMCHKFLQWTNFFIMHLHIAKNCITFWCYVEKVLHFLVPYKNA